MKFKCFILMLAAIVLVTLPGCTEHYCPDYSEIKALEIYHYPQNLEDCLKHRATDLIEGKCLSCSDLGDFMYYRFELVDSYFTFISHGTNVDNIYHVMVSKEKKKTPDKTINPVSFNVDETYLLLLERGELVYQPFDLCCLASEYLYFDIDSIESSTMNGKSLTECSQLDTIESKEALVSYMADSLQDRFHQYNVEFRYTTSDDLAYIADFCKCILKVKVIKRQFASDYESQSGKSSDIFESVGVYSCDVLSTLKADSDLPSRVYIAFDDSKVQVGGTYIVCLNNCDPEEKESERYKVWSFGSKTNMFDVSMEDTLTELVKSAE